MDGKYIDRAALFNSLANVKDVGEIFAAIQAAPAADVQEVRHGRWVKGKEWFECSVCRYEQGSAHWHYCPNCGSRMDLEGDIE